MDREVRYCTTEDDVRIAYCVEGEGPTTILALPVFFESFSLDHLMPVYQKFYRELGAGRRVIRFDWRGTGLSAQVPDGAQPIGQPAGLAADLSAVARAGGQPCVVWASTLAGMRAIELAASHPELVTHLVLYGTYAAVPDAFSEDLIEGFRALVKVNWQMAAQTIADTNGRREYPEEAGQLGDWYYQSVSREAYLAMTDPERATRTADVTAMLSEVRAPTLVLHRIADPVIPFAAGQKLAAGIPGARFVPLEGKGHLFCLGDYNKILASVDALLGDRAKDAPATPSGMTAILFADIVDSTALTERLGDVAFRHKARELDSTLRAIIVENNGTAIDGKLLGDGVLATFPSAAKAIEAALACARAGNEGDLPLHLGIHAGDVIREDGNVYGGAVNIAARVAAVSNAGETLVSGTVRDLARTSAGVSFEDRGEQSLKGINDPVRLFAVNWRDTTAS
jgi:class 3 adenylate cyclase/alpha-beta hydrolase superfamily lysophospholipase